MYIEYHVHLRYVKQKCYRTADDVGGGGDDDDVRFSFVFITRNAFLLLSFN